MQNHIRQVVINTVIDAMSQVQSIQLQEKYPYPCKSGKGIALEDY